VLDFVQVSIKRIMWDQPSNSGMEFLIFLGTGNPTYDRNTLVLSCSSIVNSLNIRIPRNLYQEPCNWALFSAGCSLVQANYKVSSSATADSVNCYTVIDATFSPPEDAKKYYQGEIHITSGDNIGIRRSLLQADAGLFTVSVPFPNKMKSGDTFDYYPGCDKTPETCRDRFSNLENFYGFCYMPAPEEALF